MEKQAFEEKRKEKILKPKLNNYYRFKMLDVTVQFAKNVY